MAEAKPPGVHCPGCGVRYPWKEELAGRKLLCRCGLKMRLPSVYGQPPAVLVMPPRVAAAARPAAAAASATSAQDSRASHAAGRAAPSAVAVADPPAGSGSAAAVAAAAAVDALNPPAALHQQESLDPLDLVPVEDDPGGGGDLVALALAEPAGAPVALAPGGTAPAHAPPAPGSHPCPSCSRYLAPNAQICIPCGININTGRAILTSSQGDLDSLYVGAEKVIRVVSFIIPLGLYPIASEAHGGRKPVTIWAITALTILVSALFLGYAIFNDTMGEQKQWMLWAGTDQPTEENAEHMQLLYEEGQGDADAFAAQVALLVQKRKSAAEAIVNRQKEAEQAVIRAKEEEAVAKKTAEERALREAQDAQEALTTGKKATVADSAPAPAQEEPEDDRFADVFAKAKEKVKAQEQEQEQTAAARNRYAQEEYSDDEGYEDDEEDYQYSALDLASTDPQILWEANRALPVGERCYGEFRWYQLLTHALLHGGLMHLAGNLLFLLVFGSRINGLVGNLPSLVLYPLLAVLAALAHMADVASGPPGAMLGASGAIMGLAGMYLVLFPMHKVHVAIWLRMGLLTGFKLFFKLFSCRGFWILLFFIFFDVLFVMLKAAAGVTSGTAHWAHLGGFISGIAIGSVLLFTRAVNARGGDLYTAMLGKFSWPLLGKPAQWQQKGDDRGWLQRVVLPMPALALAKGGGKRGKR